MKTPEVSTLKPFSPTHRPHRPFRHPQFPLTTRHVSAKSRAARFGFDASAMRARALPRCEAFPQILSAAKNTLVALHGQPFKCTPIPVCLWLSEKNNTLDSTNDARLFCGEKGLSLIA